MGNRWEAGVRPLKRNSPKDWVEIKALAKANRLEEIPADVYVRLYRTLQAIAKDHMVAPAMEREVFCFWGDTRMGKSRRAWYEAGYDAYPKGPTSIYWDGYQGHRHVVIDEFRGKIGIEHMLRWLDRHPVCVDVKFGACVLKAEKVWITSNIPPEEWYPEIDSRTLLALRSRLKVTHYSTLGGPWTPPNAGEGGLGGG